jgi:hypothetical protein
MKIECTHERRGQRIKELATGAVTDYKSINQAKSRSWEIQVGENRAIGQLGLGAVRVVR